MMSVGIPFTLRQLEYFEAIAAEGSLAAASERCHISASALALALDDLERHLGLQLTIRRKGKGVTLTPAGSHVLSLARQLLTGAETLASGASQFSEGLSGKLTLGCFSTLAPFYVPNVLQQFRFSHTGMEVEFVEAAAPELHESLLQGRIDSALMYQVDVSSELTFEAVQKIRPHVIVARDHPLAGRASIKLGELASEPLVALDVQPTRENTQLLFGSLGLEPVIGHSTGSFEVARCLVARGLGYAVMFQKPASPWTYDGHELTFLKLTDPVPATVVGLARPAGGPRTARHTALLEFLRTRPTDSQMVSVA